MIDTQIQQDPFFFWIGTYLSYLTYCTYISSVSHAGPKIDQTEMRVLYEPHPLSHNHHLRCAGAHEAVRIQGSMECASYCGTVPQSPPAPRSDKRDTVRTRARPRPQEYREWPQSRLFGTVFKTR